jgi:hypothetical protein
MDKWDILFLTFLATTDLLFFGYNLMPTIASNEIYLMINAGMFFLTAIFGMINFLGKPMLRDMRQKFEISQILDSNLSDEEKIRQMRKLEEKK